MLNAKFTQPRLPVFGFSGDPDKAPAATIYSYQAALAAGVDGLVIPIQLSRNNTLWCIPHEQPILDQPDEAIITMDPGAHFSPRLDNTPGNPSVFPWKSKPRRNRYDDSLFITLETCLRLFSRRTHIQLWAPALPDDQSITIFARLLSDLLTRFALVERVSVICPLSIYATLLNTAPTLTYVLRLDANDSGREILESDILEQVRTVVLPIDTLLNHNEPTHIVLNAPIIDVLKIARKDVCLFDNGNYISRQSVSMGLHSEPLPINSIITINPLDTIALLHKKGLIVDDPLTRSSRSHERWSFGVSKQTDKTTLQMTDEGFAIDCFGGSHYTGGGLVSKFWVYGDFDAHVDFFVSKPVKGTTLEMAAIGVDADNFPNADNLCFDVHGTPPYASSEHDENDGYRCGWNNSFSDTVMRGTIFDTEVTGTVQDANITGALKSDQIRVTKISSNMHNQYGRNVGEINANQGTLRLVRTGCYFATYYRHDNAHPWVCSGSMIVGSLGDNTRIRLAAKLWKKKNEPEAEHNQVIFRNFVLYQQ